MSMLISSPVFAHMGTIPKVYTCDGADRSPELNWGGVPSAAQSLVLIVDDPDAPDPAAPKMTWVHWVLYNIPPAATGLGEAVAPNALPPATLQGLNDWKRTGYGGPCPPVGTHRYFFKLYALDARLAERDGLTKAEVEAAMDGHIIAQAEWVGVYARS